MVYPQAPSAARMSQETAGTRYILIVRARNLALKCFEGYRWVIMDKRSNKADIEEMFRRAAAFLGDQGEAVVLARRIVGSEVDVRLLERHRAYGALDPRQFVELDAVSQRAFWNRVENTRKSTFTTKPDDSLPVNQVIRQIKAASKRKPIRWDRVFKKAAWITGSGMAIYVLTMPGVWQEVMYFLQLMRWKYNL